MSLFKVCDHWSFDLHQLYEDFSGEEADTGGVSPGEASFIASIGRFHSVGEQDVFVCAHLDGFICLLQLPESSQLQNTTTEVEKRQKVVNSQANRQALLASKLNFPIVDLKCGFFSSTLKQSVAVLSFDRLVIYHVEERQVDLISASIKRELPRLLDADLMSHQLVEYHRLDLTSFSGRWLGFPANLVIMRNHLDPAGDGHHGEHRTHRHPASLQLPQRDALLVQYTNQLMFSIVDHKKIVGHYGLLLGQPQEQSNRFDPNLSQNTGFQPACYLHDSKSPMLVVATSDHKLHCLQFAKLVAQSKQSVMKRVAQSLLFDGKKSSLSQANGNVNVKDAAQLIQVDVKLAADWQLELPEAPLELKAISKGSTGGQLLVVSRHNLDLYSSSGQHLWCQRSETPIICVHAYHPDAAQSTTGSQSSAATERKIMSLVCSSSLSLDRCNLSVMEEDRIVWSAMLSTRPLQIWCANFSRMLGVIATMGASDGCLNLSYLGTNRPETEQELQLEPGNSDELLQLLSLDEGFAFKERQLFERRADDEETGASVSREQLLAMEVKLEAQNQWPNVQVESQIKVRALSSSSGVLQNIEAVLEFDDWLSFEATGNIPNSMISDNAIQLHLGSCWPDCREPISFAGTFSCRNTGATDRFVLLPRSLMVRVYFKFNQSRQGTCVQENSFMLPLNMVTRLAHIDYSSGGQNELSLRDVHANLGPLYKRQALASFEGAQDESESPRLPYYLCDLFIKTHSDIIDLVDELIEGDLVCRGLNMASRLEKQESRSKEDRLRTLENISLLAQSLDCRLRYKSIASHQTRLTRQSSEEYSPVIMVSIALKLPNAKSTIDGLVDKDSGDDAGGDYTVAWIHLCDLTAEESVLPEEIIRQHMREWKTYEQDLVTQRHQDQPTNFQRQHRPLLITIECDYPVPVLFLQSHIVDRLSERATLLSDLGPIDLYPMTESTCDKLDINPGEGLASQSNVYSISNNLHDCLREALKNYDATVKGQIKQLKLELDKEYYKFHAASMASISLAKRLSSSPDEMNHQFSHLCTMTKSYYMKLNKILSELEQLKKLQHQFRKLPKGDHILIEKDKDNKAEAECWSELSQNL